MAISDGLCMCNVSRHQMEKSVCHFDMEHQLLRNENLRLSMQLNMADLEQLMLFQELLILEESKTKRDGLQQKLNACIKEENNIVVGAGVLLSTQMMFSYLSLVAFSPKPMQMVVAVFVTCFDSMSSFVFLHSASLS